MELRELPGWRSGGSVGRGGDAEGRESVPEGEGGARGGGIGGMFRCRRAIGVNGQSKIWISTKFSVFLERRDAIKEQRRQTDVDTKTAGYGHELCIHRVMGLGGKAALVSRMEE